MDWKTYNKFALSMTRHTPDIAVLEQKEFQLVFVCDDVMYSGKNYPIIKDCSAKISRAFTRFHYKYYVKPTDGTGVVVRVANQPRNRYDFSCGLKIKGEIHCIQSTSMTRLDNHYENGVKFRRTRTQVLRNATPHGMILNKDTLGRPLPLALQGPKHFLLPERVDPIWVWMYTAVSDYWNPLLNGMDFNTVPVFEPKVERNWLLKYYHYQTK